MKEQHERNIRLMKVGIFVALLGVVATLWSPFLFERLRGDARVENLTSTDNRGSAKSRMLEVRESAKQPEDENILIGTWIADGSGQAITFRRDGTYKSDGKQGSWSETEGGFLRLVGPNIFGIQSASSLKHEVTKESLTITASAWGQDISIVFHREK